MLLVLLLVVLLRISKLLLLGRIGKAVAGTRVCSTPVLLRGVRLRLVPAVATRVLLIIVLGGRTACILLGAGKRSCTTISSSPCCCCARVCSTAVLLLLLARDAVPWIVLLRLLV